MGGRRTGTGCADQFPSRPSIHRGQRRACPWRRERYPTAGTGDPAMRREMAGQMPKDRGGRWKHAAINTGVDDRLEASYGVDMLAEAVDAIRRGRMVVVTDDADRENEGDLVIAADAVTPESIAFMAVHGRGLICVAMEPRRLDALELAPMVPGVGAETNFAISIDLDVPGSTGISAADRAATIRRAVDASSVASDFRRPGHVFPLRYTPGGVLARRGHTEASIDLARMAGRTPAGVICEILNDDGTMARGAVLRSFAEWYGLPMISVAELADHLRANPQWADQSGAGSDAVVRLAAETVLPSRYGDWRTFGFRGGDGLEYVVLVRGTPGADGPALVRLPDATVASNCRCRCARSATRAPARWSTSAVTRAVGSACCPSCAPTRCRIRGSTPSTRTWPWATVRILASTRARPRCCGR
jgi:3,4-dihydroxy-2-butanone 4-phosphate synthase